MAFPNSHISYGSESRSVDILRPLLHLSPFWGSIHSFLSKGARYPLSRISNQRRLQDIEDAIKRGNHKSAKSSPSTLCDLVSKDISRGFQLPISLKALHKIPHAIVAPYGLVHQFTIDEQGNRADKYRMTHDQSFRFSSGSSVNNRVKNKSYWNWSTGMPFAGSYITSTHCATITPITEFSSASTTSSVRTDA